MKEQRIKRKEIERDLAKVICGTIASDTSDTIVIEDDGVEFVWAGFGSGYYDVVDTNGEEKKLLGRLEIIKDPSDTDELRAIGMFRDFAFTVERRFKIDRLCGYLETYATRLLTTKMAIDEVALPRLNKDIDLNLIKGLKSAQDQIDKAYNTIVGIETVMINIAEAGF